MSDDTIRVWIDRYNTIDNKTSPTFWFNNDCMESAIQLLELAEVERDNSINQINEGLGYSVMFSYIADNNKPSLHLVEVTTTPIQIIVNIADTMTEGIEWFEKANKPYPVYIHPFAPSVDSCFFYKNQERLGIKVEKDVLNCLGAPIDNQDESRVHDECLKCRFFSKCGRDRMNATHSE